jgi:proline racemase
MGTVFKGELIEETRLEDRKAVVPMVTGQAWITGTNQYVIDETDPFPEGFTIGDLW